MAYLFLFVPSILASVAHWAFMPKFVALLSEEFANIPLPQLTVFAIRGAPILYSGSLLLLCCSFFATRSGFLTSPKTVGAAGAAVALSLFLYGVGTTLPLVTLLDRMG
jgi:hypothetical protein